MLSILGGLYSGSQKGIKGHGDNIMKTMDSAFGVCTNCGSIAAFADDLETVEQREFYVCLCDYCIYEIQLEQDGAYGKL